MSDDDMGPKWRDEWQTNMSKWLAEGSIKTKICMNDGIEKAGEAIVGVLEGRNFGKAILKV